MKQNKKLFVILLIILFFLSIGGTYAYFQLTIIGNEDAKDIITTTGTLIVNYKEGRSLSLLEAFPGSEAFKNFSVENVGTLEAEYDIMWKDILNTFVDKSDLMYIVTCETNDENGSCGEQNTYKQVPNTTNLQEMIKHVSILPGETHTYKLTLYFLETNNDQNDNQGKTIATNVQINGYEPALLTMNIENGTLDKNTDRVEYGGSSTFTVTPDEGYSINDLLIDCDENTTRTVVDNEITFNPVYISDTCRISFEPVFSMRGYVVNQDDVAMPFTTLELHSEPKVVVTDEEGYFKIDSIEQGNHEIQVTRRGVNLHNSNFNITPGVNLNIAGNQVTAKISEPIKVIIKVSDLSNKTLSIDSLNRVKIIAVNGSVANSTSRVEDGGTVSTTITPSPGHEYKDIECTNGAEGTVVNNTCTINNITEDTECLVGFDSEIILVTLNSHNDLGSTMKSVAYNEYYGELPIPEREFYTFTGWYTSNEGGSLVTENTIVSNPNDHTLHARYTPSGYEVVYNCNENGGTCFYENRSVEYGSSIDLSLIGNKEGYEFLGWNTDKDATTALSNLVMDSEGKTLYAIFRKTINITYDNNGSTLSKNSDTCVIYNKTTTCQFKSPIITRAYYRLLGFSTYQDASEADFAPDVYYTVSDNTTYYAITIEDINPIISLNKNSGTTYIKEQVVQVTISDISGGLKSNQLVKYGWSISNITAPSEYTTVNMTNSEGDTSFVFNASNNTLNGQYYLWVQPVSDLCDVNDNCSTEIVTSPGKFYFDNTGPVSTNYQVTSEGNTISIVYNATDTYNSVVSYNYATTTTDTCDGASYVPSTNPMYEKSGLQDNQYTVCAYSTDAVGNNSEVSFASVNVYELPTAALITSSYSCSNANVGSGTKVFTYTGKCSVSKYGNDDEWKIKFLSDGTFVSSKQLVIDAYFLGGGGGGCQDSWGDYDSGTGAVGYSKTVKRIAVNPGEPYVIDVGDGGSCNVNGKKSSGFDYSSSGGSSATCNNDYYCSGSEYGCFYTCLNPVNHTSGGTVNAYEFGEPAMSTRYANCCSNGANTGNSNRGNASGGSGIVVIRNASYGVPIIIQDTLIGYYNGSMNITNADNANWKVQFLTSGTFRSVVNKDLTAFYIGGGGGGCYDGWGSYSKARGTAGSSTTQNISITADTSYEIVVGSGGSCNGTGGNSSGFGSSASGGVSATCDNTYYCSGEEYGCFYTCLSPVNNNQGDRTVYEFNDTSGNLFGTCCNSNSNSGNANIGPGSGGSGIVSIKAR